MAKPTLYTKEMIEKYTQAGYWETMSLSDYWERNAHECPQREAIVDSKTRLTWAEAKQWIDRLALGFLELGLKRDQVVAIQLPNCVELAILKVACERAGLLHLPLLRTLRHAEMEHILRYTEAVAIVITWTYRNFDYFSMIQELCPNLPSLKYTIVLGDEVPEGTISVQKMLDKPLEKKYPPDYLDGHKLPSLEYSLIGLTTGTTGLPKFVETPICCRIASGQIITTSLLKLTSEDTLGAMSPAATGPNTSAYYAAPWVKARVAILENWSVEEGLKLIEKERVTVPLFVPTQLAEITAYPGIRSLDLSSVRVVWSSGAYLPYHLGVEIEEKLGWRLMQSYGAVDFGGIAAAPVDEPQEVRLLTVGYPPPGNEIKLVDPSGNEVSPGQIGEITVRGPQSSSGYYKDPEATFKAWSADGWFRTGDLGKWDEQGRLVIAGREKDMIIRGGQNIYPVEVENYLLTHPKVASAAIVGIPDPVFGERACACVVPQTDQDLAFEEMVAFLKTKRMAAYKLPERLMLLDSLPFVGGLKLDRKALRADVIKRLQAKGSGDDKQRVV